jgi:hypothetical protein
LKLMTEQLEKPKSHTRLRSAFFHLLMAMCHRTLTMKIKHRLLSLLAQPLRLKHFRHRSQLSNSNSTLATEIFRHKDIFPIREFETSNGLYQ